MGWNHDYLYQGVPLEFLHLRELERLDHPECGPQAFHDQDRAERWSDHVPSRWWRGFPAPDHANAPAGSSLTLAHEQEPSGPLTPHSRRGVARSAQAVAGDLLHEREATTHRRSAA